MVANETHGKTRMDPWFFHQNTLMLSHRDFAKKMKMFEHVVLFGKRASFASLSGSET